MIYQRGKLKVIKVIVFVLFLFTLLFLIKGNAESNIFPVGTVLGIGQAELELIPGRMITISNTEYPLFSDSKLRTRDGKISITLKDKGRIEVYKNSELSILGGDGTYRVNLNKGTLAFSFPHTTSVTIITPTATIETVSSGALQRVTYKKEIDYIKGLVIIDEKGNTQVISVSGEMAVRDVRGNYQILASGNSLYISGDSYKVVPAQAPEVGLPPPPPPPFYTYLPYIAGAAGAGASGYIMYEIYKSATEEEVASPSVP